MLDVLEYVEDLEKESSATIGLYFKKINTGQEIRHNENFLFPAASVIKIPIMMEIFNKASKGIFDLDDAIIIDKDTGGPRGGGILKHLKLPINLSIRNLCTLMIILSDNIASNKMIDLAGFNKVTQLCKNLGASDIVLKRYFVGTGISDIDKDNTISPKSLGIILEKLYNKQVVDSESSAEMLSIMKKQQIRHKIPKYLPQDTIIAHKTGTQEISSHDAGIVFGEKGLDYIISICCTNIAARPAGDEIVSKISKVLYQFANKTSDKEG